MWGPDPYARAESAWAHTNVLYTKLHFLIGGMDGSVLQMQGVNTNESLDEFQQPPDNVVGWSFGAMLFRV